MVTGLGFKTACVTAALVLVAASEAVHLYAEGSLHHADKSGGRPATYPDWNHTLQLTSLQSFHTTLRSDPLALVYFYTPWSASSIKFYGRLDNDVAKPMFERNPPVPVYAVDLSQVPDVGKQLRINNFPTFAAFRHGVIASAAENQFPRHPAGIVKHLLALLKPAFATITDVSDLEKLVQREEPRIPIAPTGKRSRFEDDRIAKTIVVGFFGSEENQEQFHSAARLAGPYFRLALTNSEAVATAYGQKMETVVIFRRWGDQSPIVLTGKDDMLDVAEIARFLIYSAIPPMEVFDEDTRTLFAQRHKPLLIYFSPKRLQSSDVRFAQLEHVGLDNEMNVTVAQTNPVDAGRLVLHFLGLDQALGSKTWAIGLLVGRKKYRFDSANEPTAENLRAFVRNVLVGAVAEFHKSEAHSIMPGAGKVADLAFADFNKQVIDDNEKDMVILFYNPRDQMSRQLMPIFTQVASELKRVPGVVVARMNVIENDYHDAYATVGVPSILYARRDNKTSPIHLTGVARTVGNIVQFVAENAAVSLGDLAPSNRTPGTARGRTTADTDEL